MVASCVDCNFTFTTGPDGQRMLTPAMEFIRMTRLTALELSDSLDPTNILTWPTVAEDVTDIAPGCPQAVVRASTSAFRVTEPGWFDVRASLLGESVTNCLDVDDDNWMAGVGIQLDRGGELSVVTADIKERDACHSYSYACSAMRRFEDDDLLRAFYWLESFGTVGTTPTLPGSSRNFFSINLVRRAS